MWCMEVVVGKIMSYYSGDRLIDVDQPITGEVSRDGVRLGHGPSATNVALGARDAMYDAVFLRSAHNQKDAELDEALAGMSRDGLAALVRHAARTGTQTTQLSITIAAMAPPPTSRGGATIPGREPTPRAVHCLTAVDWMAAVCCERTARMNPCMMIVASYRARPPRPRCVQAIAGRSGARKIRTLGRW